MTAGRVAFVVTFIAIGLPIGIWLTGRMWGYW